MASTATRTSIALTFTLEQWKATNPILRTGELGYESDTNRLRIGNGRQPFLDLIPIVYDEQVPIHELRDATENVEVGGNKHDLFLGQLISPFKAIHLWAEDEITLTGPRQLVLSATSEIQVVNYRNQVAYNLPVMGPLDRDSFLYWEDNRHPRWMSRDEFRQQLSNPALNDLIASTKDAIVDGAGFSASFTNFDTLGLDAKHIHFAADLLSVRNPVTQQEEYRFPTTGFTPTGEDFIMVWSDPQTPRWNRIETLQGELNLGDAIVEGLNHKLTFQDLQHLLFDATTIELKSDNPIQISANRGPLYSLPAMAPPTGTYTMQWVNGQPTFQESSVLADSSIPSMLRVGDADVLMYAHRLLFRDVESLRVDAEKEIIHTGETLQFEASVKLRFGGTVGYDFPLAAPDPNNDQIILWQANPGGENVPTWANPASTFVTPVFQDASAIGLPPAGTPPGLQAIVQQTPTGEDYWMAYVFDGITAYHTLGNRVFLRADDTDAPPGATGNEGDLLLYNGADKVINIFNDQIGDWQEIYSEKRVKELIAMNSLFQGTLRLNPPFQGAEQFNAAWLAANVADTGNKGHYWVITEDMTPVSGTGTALDGVTLRVGDWLQSTGDPTQGLDGWTIVSGDILSKSRGDMLYGIERWRPGERWEKGAMANYGGYIWRVKQSIQGTDPVSLNAPGNGVVPQLPANPTYTLIAELGQFADLNNLLAELPDPSIPNRGMYFTMTGAATIAEDYYPGLPAGTQLNAGDVIWSDGIYYHVESAPFDPTTDTVAMPDIPNLPLSPWEPMILKATLNTVTVAQRPTADTSGNVYVVLDDPRVGGNPSLQRYDQATGEWVVINAGADLLDMNTGVITNAAVAHTDASAPPTNPASGELYYDTDTGELLIYLADWDQPTSTWLNGVWCEIA